MVDPLSHSLTFSRNGKMIFELVRIRPTFSERVREMMRTRRRTARECETAERDREMEDAEKVSQ